MTNARWNLWLLSLAVLAVLTTSPLRLGYGQTPAPLKHDVIINEIHYHPDVKTELVEFIELYNKSSAAVDLSGWRLTKAVEYTFPAGTSIPANGYVVVTENPAAFQAKFKTSALGPWTGVLSNDGETIRLLDAAKRVVNEVAYQEGFPWPTVGDAPGYSLELINPEPGQHAGRQLAFRQPDRIDRCGTGGHVIPLRQLVALPQGHLGGLHADRGVARAWVLWRTGPGRSTTHRSGTIPWRPTPGPAWTT